MKGQIDGKGELNLELDHNNLGAVQDNVWKIKLGHLARGCCVFQLPLNQIRGVVIVGCRGPNREHLVLARVD